MAGPVKKHRCGECVSWPDNHQGSFFCGQKRDWVFKTTSICLYGKKKRDDRS
jgi:hypothetical protein